LLTIVLSIVFVWLVSVLFTWMLSAPNDDDDSFDPYEILGINAGETDLTVIKKAFRRLSLKYHPEKYYSVEDELVAAEAKFIMVQKAYDKLTGEGEYL